MFLCRKEKFPRPGREERPRVQVDIGLKTGRCGESNERRREIKAIKLPLPPKAGNQGGNKAGSIVFLNPYFIGWTITIGHVTPENQKLKAILDELSE